MDTLIYCMEVLIRNSHPPTYTAGWSLVCRGTVTVYNILERLGGASCDASETFGGTCTCKKLEPIAYQEVLISHLLHL